MRPKSFRIYSNSQPQRMSDERIAELIEERFDSMDIEEQVFSTRHIKLIQNWQHCSSSYAWLLHKVWQSFYGENHVQYFEHRVLTKFRS